MTSNPQHLQNLNPPQLDAVKHFKGPILILAGAGSGKTRVLTRRVAHLVLEHQINPANILAVTFTNKATEEMRSRLRILLGPSAKGLWIATFHSACLRILRSHANHLGYDRSFVVYDDQDTSALLKRVLKKMQIDPKKHPVNFFKVCIEQAKNAMLSPEEYAQDFSGYTQSLTAEVYDRYQRTLRESNAMDFGDLLFNVVLLFQRYPEALAVYRRSLHFILVDEFQDTNKVQYAFLRLLAEPRRNLLVVGDDDQAIYSFRGATIQNILNFEKDFPETKVVTLEQNYRSTEVILEVAHSVIEKNKSRKPKKLWTSATQGANVFTCVAYDEAEEAEFIVYEISAWREQGITLREMAAFYRTNAQSRAIEEALIEAQIPYRIFGGLKFYDRKEIKDILAYLRLLISPTDNQSFYRIVNNPPRGIGARTVQQIMQFAVDNQICLWEAACQLSNQHKSLGKFVKLIQEFQNLLDQVVLAELISIVIEKSGYLKRLKDSKDITAESRIENLQELQAVCRSPNYLEHNADLSLRDFLDRASLTTADETSDKGKQLHDPEDYFSLMTLHLTKGLEFRIAFLSGLEEGLLPHYRSIDTPSEIDEERRLCYVGITRAMQQLYLTRAVCRGIFSAGDGFGLTGRYREPSRFLYDIPTSYLETKYGGDIYQSTYYLEDHEEFTDNEVEYEVAEELQPLSSWGKGPRKKKKKLPQAKIIVADDL